MRRAIAEQISFQAHSPPTGWLWQATRAHSELATIRKLVYKFVHACQVCFVKSASARGAPWRDWVMNGIIAVGGYLPQLRLDRKAYARDLAWSGLPMPRAGDHANSRRAATGALLDALQGSTAELIVAGEKRETHLRGRVDIEKILAAPLIADPLRLFDCCGVSDGAACAIVTTPEIARVLGKADPVTIKAIQLAASNGTEMQFGERWDGASVPNTRAAAARAYAEAGIRDPRVARYSRWTVRCRWRVALPTRRWTEMLRPPGRRFGLAHGLRGLHPVAGPRGRPPARQGRSGAHAQSRRIAVQQRRRSGDPWSNELKDN